MIYVAFQSHRARQHSLACLDRAPHAYFSMRRRSAGGYYLVTEYEASLMRGHSRFPYFTVLRGPYDDLAPCW